jgi:hypothetical protein
MYLPGMRADRGIHQVELPMHRPARADGKASSRPGEACDGLNALFAFSNAPLRLASWIGVFVATGAGSLPGLVYFCCSLIKRCRDSQG